MPTSIVYLFALLLREKYCRSRCVRRGREGGFLYRSSFELSCKDVVKSLYVAIRLVSSRNGVTIRIESEKVYTSVKYI